MAYAVLPLRKHKTLSRRTCKVGDLLSEEIKARKLRSEIGGRTIKAKCRNDSWTKGRVEKK